MTMTCIEAQKGATCCRCGRSFAKNELIFTDKEGDQTCYGTCWRTLRAKAQPARIIPFPTPAKTRVKKPAAAVEKAPAETVRPTDSALPSDMLREEIADYARKLKGKEKIWPSEMMDFDGR